MSHPRAKPVDSTWKYVQKPITLPSALWFSTILSCLDIAVASSLVSLPPLPPLQSILSNVARMTLLKQKAGHVTPLLRAFKGFPFQRKSQKCSPWPTGSCMVWHLLPPCHITLIPTSGPLHLLPTPSPILHIYMAHSLTCFEVLLRCHPLGEAFLDHSEKQPLLAPATIPFPCFIHSP